MVIETTTPPVQRSPLPLPCPRCPGVLLADGDDLICICGYRGGGSLPAQGTKPGYVLSSPIESTIRTKRGKITVYRLKQCWTAKPEPEAFIFGYTYQETIGQALKNGRRYKLLGLLGVPGNIWPHEATPRKRKWHGPFGQVNARQELKDAIAHAICRDLGAEPHEIIALHSVIRTDTNINAKTFGSRESFFTTQPVIIASYCLWPRGGG